MALDARRLRFEAVKATLTLSLDPDFTVEVLTNDAMEPTLEVRLPNMVWLFGMMDEPVWGYEAEVDPGDGRSWALVRQESLELPEASEPNVVAADIKSTVEQERRQIERDLEIESLEDRYGATFEAVRNALSASVLRGPLVGSVVRGSHADSGPCVSFSGGGFVWEAFAQIPQAGAEAVWWYRLHQARQGGVPIKPWPLLKTEPLGLRLSASPEDVVTTFSHAIREDSMRLALEDHRA